MNWKIQYGVFKAYFNILFHLQNTFQSLIANDYNRKKYYSLVYGNWLTWKKWKDIPATDITISNTSYE